MAINKALLKVGYYNFSLEILEYCEPSKCIEREQYYLNLLQPEYNILKIAGSSLGYQHSEEAKKKISEAKKNMTEETKKRISEAHLGKNHSEETRKKISEAHIGREPTTGIKVEVTDIKTNITTIYESIVKAAKGLGVNVKTL
jgi:group I intron endonuclease